MDKLISNVNKKNNIYMISLENQLIKCDDLEIKFKIDNRRKEVLIKGIDDISETLKLSDKIKEYENIKAVKTPWMFNG